MVAWSLTITDLDPLRFGLLFERFLNPERVSMPDFDVDFCQDRRDEVIRYVQQKYGADRVAQIITFGKLQARAVLRDVGRVLAMPYGQVDRLCKLVPNNPAHPVTLEKAIAGEPVLQQLRDGDETVARLIEIALKLEGLYRHASTHAAGVVIGDRPLAELVPLYRDARSNMPVTQFSMKWVELAGLVKFDFLGLKTLDVLQQAVALLEARGVEIDLANLPLDDAKTYALIARGDTTGVFQLESSGMRDSLRKLRPNRFEDIIAMNALYRPGPMDSIPKYIKCKNGEEPIYYPHPLLEPILKDTFGVFTYQEQVMQAAQIMAGYSLGSADLLRRAMGKKNASEMAAQRGNFVAGAAKNGVDDQQANLVFDLMEKFSGYGFNKSHSAPYALIAYQTAYLKANHPVEFIAASMTLDMGNTDKLNQFRQEADRLAISLLPPDINNSGVAFSVETDPKTGKPAIRYALAAVKGVGGQAMAELVREREQNGRFRDLFDLARRLDAKSFNRGQFESLAKAGAFDILNPNRAQSFAAADLLLRQASRTAAERQDGQGSLFGIGLSDRPSLPLIDDWPRGRPVAARIRGDRFLPVEPPARRLWQKPRTGRHPAFGRFAGGLGGEHDDPVPSGRHRHRPQGKNLGARQPVCLCPDVGPERGLRGHPVRRDAARSTGVARCRPAARGHGRCAQRGGQPAADRAKDRAARRHRRSYRSRAAGVSCRSPRPRHAEEPDLLRGRWPRPRLGRARPARARSRNRDPRRLPGRSKSPRRGQIFARDRRRLRYLSCKLPGLATAR